MIRFLLFLSLLISPSLRAETWSFVHIPDWHVITPAYWTNSISNLNANLSTWNTKVVISTGDMGPNDTAGNNKWGMLTNSYYPLATTTPLILSPGNHDYTDTNHSASASWNLNFGTAWYTNHTWWGGGSFASNSFSDVGVAWTFTNNTEKWIFVGLEYAFRTNTILWASNIFTSYPQHHGVLFAHEFLDRFGKLFTTTNQFFDSWDNEIAAHDAWLQTLQYIPNLLVTVSGHDICSPQYSSLRQTASDGHFVNSFFLNYQCNGGFTDLTWTGGFPARVYSYDTSTGWFTVQTFNMYDMTPKTEAGNMFSFPLAGRFMNTGGLSIGGLKGQ